MDSSLAGGIHNTWDGAMPESLMDLPCVNTGYSNHQIQGPEWDPFVDAMMDELLQEVGDWIITSGSQICAFVGPPDTGKSTIAMAIARIADVFRLLGASFFFPRNESKRRTAQKFFSTLAFQLCVCDKEFATAIESVMLTKRGKCAATGSPVEQLRVLILEPLRDIVHRPVVVVVDGLNECEDEDGLAILSALGQLAQNMPWFKVILTTRPRLGPFLSIDKPSVKVIRLHNTANNVINGFLPIDVSAYHTELAIGCLKIMNSRFKRRNISVGGFPDFNMELRYACIHWAKHITGADSEDPNLMEELNLFMEQPLQHWLEAMRSIGKQESAHHTLLVIQRFPKLTYLRGPVAYTRSILPKYRAAYRGTKSYYQIKNGARGGITTDGHAEPVQGVVFSPDSTILASRGKESMKLWDGINGLYLATFMGEGIACELGVDPAGSSKKVPLKPDAKVIRLEVSFHSRIVAAGLEDGTVCLWDTRECKSVARHSGWRTSDGLALSMAAEKLSYISDNGHITLIDWSTGESVITIPHFPQGADHSLASDGAILGHHHRDVRNAQGEDHTLAFSSDGSRLALLEKPKGPVGTLVLWNVEDVRVVGVVGFATRTDVGDSLAVSPDGSLLATGAGRIVKVWGVTHGDLLRRLDSVDVGTLVNALALAQDNMLAVASLRTYAVELYEFKDHCLTLSTTVYISSGFPTALAFSPDCRRLAAGNDNGSLHIWEVRGPEARGFKLPFAPGTTSTSSLAGGSQLGDDC